MDFMITAQMESDDATFQIRRRNVSDPTTQRFRSETVIRRRNFSDSQNRGRRRNGGFLDGGRENIYKENNYDLYIRRDINIPQDIH
jgi:hypothetical protein